VARTLRDSDADLISLKLGINVINADTMRERVFVPAVHGFLDTIRDRKPDTPILVVSPIICPVAEAHPGPTLRAGTGVRIVERPGDLHPGALSVQRIRKLLGGIVDRRRAAGDRNLHYLDGLGLFSEADTQDLPDGLHPNPEGLVRIGERFAKLAFGPEGPFAA
jgi:lysophospholipase L1-like esterase